jgi:hypothetical protein
VKPVRPEGVPEACPALPQRHAWAASATFPEAFHSPAAGSGKHGTGFKPSRFHPFILYLPVGDALQARSRRRPKVSLLHSWKWREN